MRSKYMLSGIVVGVLLASAAVVLAGQIDSPAGPTDPTAQMYTLEQIYQRLNNSTAATKMVAFTEPSSGPGSTMHTLDDIYGLAWPARVPKTGDTYTDGGVTGKDGDLQKDVALPSPRFTDNGDGTVTDNLTGLIWLKDANCVATKYPGFDNDGTPGDGAVTWQHALDFVAGINDRTTYPDCGAGHTDWRLPNVRELFRLIDFLRPIEAPWVALPNGHPFDNVRSFGYWSRTAYMPNRTLACYVLLYGGYVGLDAKARTHYVWPVRGGQ